jgi:exodeoxyribonuclease-1
MRDKKAVAKLVNLDEPQPFVYASGRYSAEFEKTTVAAAIAPANKPNAVLVWDLRFSPDDFAGLTEQEIFAKLNAKYEEKIAKDFVAMPVKELCLNKCPAVAPIGTLDEDSEKRIQLSRKTAEKNFAKLQKNRDLIDKISAAFARRPEFQKSADVEGQLYDSFTPDVDRPKIRAVAAADADDLADFHPNFADERLTELLLRFKARNFAKSLSADEKLVYEKYRAEKLAKELPKYLAILRDLALIARDEEPKHFANENEKTGFDKLKNRVGGREIDSYVLEELQLWAESIWPTED